ncbi:MAG: translation elongation factor 4 [Dehalococcoidales bacterium]|jgi:GTP-binding protein LepA|nr:translation elongation factor 4 [Dehalococcoidales bacterium]MDD3264362.1 translation elongation factor 4 [Dehalococcoidales bacterium]MDD4322128.1 translation elongation factor 4 [Dehalococcoidales bacterium]MDD4793698.1 translation elongation factor 4 [Dehalococcoidales bacterium]MDD5497969.1 translation elongation factor 4 [Dehalococcoidales bacterium]
MNQNLIRNFCIIAHIDHGKSTLADRLIDIAGTMKRSKVTEQVMDSMELERERGITIKAKAVRLDYKNRAGEHFRLNLIDTPGHVDFSYEVSRTLVACEGAVLVIDATQGIQAQTLANIYIAMEHNLVVIPVINKIDLPGSEPERVMEEIKSVLGYNLSETFFISAKTGQGVGELVEAIVDRIPPPGGDLNLPTRALIFDSHYDDYKGVIAYVRVVDGRLEKGSKVRLMGEGTQMEVLELGYFAPDPTPAESLQAGEVGYIATGLKSVAECRVGDTVTVVSGGATEPLIGYDLPKPMVYAGIYPTQADDYADLREAIEKLNLNDASLTFEPEASPILGQGFRCGFLGLLHLDIVVERLEREFGLSLVVTIPGVKFMVTKTSGEISDVTSPVDFPDPSEIAKIEEPWVRISVVTPSNFIGALMEVMQEFEGVYKHTEYLGQFTALGETGQRVQLEYEMPLRSMLTTFYDYLKSRSRGYASLDHELLGYREAKLVKLDVLVNDVKVDAFSRIIPPEKAHDIGKAVVSKLKDSIPRQLFKVPLQAAIGGRIVAREDISARRKDVLSKCYGGDITRKRKLLEKQKEGKKKMKMIGKVEVPKEAFLSIMKLG